MLHGIYCPSITPFNEDGSIDFESWADHFNFLIEAGIDGILIFGSIGEFYSLTVEEKKEAIEFAAKAIAGKTTLLVGTGSTRIADTLELNQHAKKCGADAVVVVSPFYFGPTDEGAQQYYGQIADATELPLVLYNFPDRTGNDLDPALVKELVAQHPTIIGMKDTVDSAAHNRHSIAAVQENFAVLSGFDEYYFTNRIAGGAGVLSGLTNIIPEVFVSMHKAYESGDFATAVEKAAVISKFMAVYDIGDLFTTTIKTAVQMRRGNALSPRLHEPSVPLTDAEKERVSALLSNVK